MIYVKCLACFMYHVAVEHSSLESPDRFPVIIRQSVLFTPSSPSAWEIAHRYSIASIAQLPQTQEILKENALYFCHDEARISAYCGFKLRPFPCLCRHWSSCTAPSPRHCEPSAPSEPSEQLELLDYPDHSPIPSQYVARKPRCSLQW